MSSSAEVVLWNIIIERKVITAGAIEILRLYVTIEE